MPSRRPAVQPIPGAQDGKGIPTALVLGGGSLLQQVGRELATTLQRRLTPFGITAQQAALLLHAGRHDHSPSQLMALLGTDTAGMTRLLDRLERKGLLNRRKHPDDRRSVLIEITDQGSAIVPHLPPVFGCVTGQLLAGFSSDEVSQLTALLQRMLENLHTDGTQAPSAPGAHAGRGHLASR